MEYQLDVSSTDIYNNNEGYQVFLSSFLLLVPPNIFFGNLFLDSLNLCSSPRMS
jgi:hypothetical protein